MQWKVILPHGTVKVSAHNEMHVIVRVLTFGAGGGGEIVNATSPVLCNSLAQITSPNVAIISIALFVVVHVKPANLLLNSGCSVKLGLTECDLCNC